MTCMDDYLRADKVSCPTCSKAIIGFRHDGHVSKYLKLYLDLEEVPSNVEPTEHARLLDKYAGLQADVDKLQRLAKRTAVIHALEKATLDMQLVLDKRTHEQMAVDTAAAHATKLLSKEQELQMEKEAHRQAAERVTSVTMEKQKLEGHLREHVALLEQSQEQVMTSVSQVSQLEAYVVYYNYIIAVS